MSSKEKYLKEIFAISSEITNCGESSDLFYKRGYLYFLSDEQEKAKEDYRQAVKLGLDFTEFPYYTFSPSNEMRRDFLLPEKILVFLILIIVGVALFFQVSGFVLRLKGLV